MESKIILSFFCIKQSSIFLTQLEAPTEIVEYAIEIANSHKVTTILNPAPARKLSYKTIGTSAMQSRACAVLANGKYIFALPGSSGGVTDAWDGILKYQLDINHKPCNFVELFPRLKEK